MRRLCLLVLLAGLSVALPRVMAAEDVLASPASLAAWSRTFSTVEERLLDEIQQGAFLYFWREVGEPANLAKDKTSDVICSTAAVGFQLSSLPIGVERGWITRAEGEERALTVLRALVERDDNKKDGVYLHLVDKDTGGLPNLATSKVQYEIQASTVDHALLQAGVMTASSYFGGEVARLGDRLIADTNWKAFERAEDGFISMGWRASTPQGVAGPGSQPPWHWQWASDEERLIYFLAVGAPNPQHAVPPQAYYQLKRVLGRHGDMPPFVMSWNGSLFTYFFSHSWINYRDLAADDPAAFGQPGPRVDWFENSRRAALTMRQRSIEAAGEYPTLGENRWGFAPCSHGDRYLVQELKPNHSNRDVWDDGVVAPYAAGSSIVFTPEESLAALAEYRSLRTTGGKPLVWRSPSEGGYGLVDSFRLKPDTAPEEYLGIDHGPMLLAIENARSGLIWRLFMEHPVAKAAVERLGLERRVPSTPAE